jgi:LPXTG-site transpeptidase (sortase) family protein
MDLSKNEPKSLVAKIQGFRPAAILALSLVLLFGVSGVSYANFQKNSRLLKETEQQKMEKGSRVSGSFFAPGGTAPQIAPGDTAPQIALEQPQRLSPASPGHIDIPALGISSGMEHLGLTADNAIATPKSLWSTAWFNQSSKPGDPGPALIVGHYSRYGKAIFANLHKLQNGQQILITDEGGQQFIFQVTAVKSVSTAQFPMNEVLGNTDSRSRLEIITCGGAYIKQTKDFTERTVITAELI